jgi:hypothetical protein
VTFGMTRFGANAASLRVGEIRLEDIVHQVGEARQFVVHVLDRAGVALQIHLRITEKWGGSWQRQLQCPQCNRPARVLAVHEGSAVCGRCAPRRTAHHRHKNSRAWRHEGALADEVARAALRGTSSRSRMRRLIGQLKERSLGGAEHARDDAMRLALAIDLSGLLHR